MKTEICLDEYLNGKCRICEVEYHEKYCRTRWLTGRRNGITYWSCAWWMGKFYTKKTAEKIAEELKAVLR